PNAKATWLKPELVCEVAFAEITNDGVFRHPSFKGMRDDKKAKDVIRETELPAEDIVAEVNQQDSEPTVKKPLVKAPKGTIPKTLLHPTEKAHVKKIWGHDLKFTNLDKLYWPEDNISKRDMFNYYYQVAEYMLPHLKDRP